MSLIDILKLLKYEGFSNKQRNELKKKFEEHKRNLEAAIRAVDRGIEALAKKPKTKRTAKRRTVRRPTKG
jgi:hypothetical protein